MSDDEPFFRAIEAEPAADTPRLVYADWLDDQDRPREADYLRAELELARLPADALAIGPARDRLWRAWGAVDPGWLARLTQPRTLRANPTPFPAEWRNFDLGELRPGEGTYDGWPYTSVPDLPLADLLGDFAYLTADGGEVGRRRERVGRVEVAAARLGVRLPAGFVRFMTDGLTLGNVGSPTDCFLTLPDEHTPVRVDPAGGGVHVHFYCDSQSCLLWDLYLHPAGGYCVIARWLDYFEPEPDPEDEEPYTGPRAWFVAPSFEAFILRTWLENRIWYVEHADFLRELGQEVPPVTPAMQAYIDHYRNRGRERRQ